MVMHADKGQRDKSNAIANRSSVKRETPDSSIQLIDRRPEAIAQRRLRDAANNSPQTMRLMSFQDMAANSPQSQKLTQLQAMADNSPRAEALGQQNGASTKASPSTDKDLEQEDFEEISEEPADEEIEDIGSGAASDVSEATDKDLLKNPETRRMFIPKESFKLGEETHSISFDLIGGELELGVASKWTRLRTIHTRLRTRVGGLHADVSQAFQQFRLSKRFYDQAKNTFQTREHRVLQLIVPYTGPRYVSPRNVPSYLPKSKRRTYFIYLKRQENARSTLDTRVRLYKRNANVYLNEAFRIYGPQVGDILADLAPTQTTAPHAGLAVPPNVHRYHEGTAGDPIPIVWYKPLNQYPNLTLQAYDNAANPVFFNIAYPGNNTVVYDNLGNPYNFTVNAGNRAPGKVLANNFDIRNVRQTNTRATQQALNQVIVGMNFNMGNMDGDHVLDLGFNGLDQIDNFWPLPRAVNQRALVWRRAYRFHFKENQNGAWVLRSGTIDGLPGKYFRIKGEQNADIPAESGTANAGDAITYGNAQLIDVNGANVQEA